MAILKDTLQDAVLKEIEKIGETDILVGIPSYNNVRTIGHVVRAVSAGLAKYFPDQHAVLVNSDGGSTDGTDDVVRTTEIEDIDTILIRHPLYPIHKIVTPYTGVPGKGSAFRTIFKIAEALNARACAVFDSDLRSITPEWVELLVEPVYKLDFDFVAPLYNRHKFDGTITNSIVYPLTRALYGQRIRQPIGGDFGFSGQLARRFLKEKIWDSDIARYGIDIWMTTTAVTNGFKVCQSFLGAKIHDAKDPGADLTQMLTQVVGSVFGLMEAHQDAWLNIKESKRINEFGFKFEVGVEPVKVNVARMVDAFKQGARSLKDIWSKILHVDTLKAVYDLTAYEPEDFRFPLETWVRVIYDYATAFHKKKMAPDHILSSLTPLYLGKTAAFVIENFESDAGEVESRIEQLCNEFEKQKSYLLENW
jgi:glycosyltransferase involved in cell wall biosynthesis